MLLKTNSGGNFTWRTSSISGGFECKVKMLYITICSHFISLSRSFLRARLNSTLPGDRRFLLHWTPLEQCMLTQFCRYQRLGDWILAARDACNWGHWCQNFSILALDPQDRQFCFMYRQVFFHLCLSWAAFGHIGFMHSLCVSELQLSWKIRTQTPTTRKHRGMTHRPQKICS